jgi:alpha-ketoglutarate-dependent taurine dioxygenase
MKITFEPIKQLIGASVTVAKKDLCDPEVVDAIRQAIEKYGVLVFPRFEISDADQLAFTDCLGERVNFTRRVPGSDASAEDVYKITLDENFNSEPDYVLGTFFWHVDGVTMDMALPKATLLSARSLADEGGATEFANLFAAYELLPEAEKQQIEGLRVLHTIETGLRPVYGHPPQERLDRWRSMTAPMEHPLVWEHPDGRKSLLLGTHADTIIGQPSVNGRALLWRLQQWGAQPDFVYRHEWQVGDLVVWNNEGLMHRVIPYTDGRRTMHRTTINGHQRPGRPASEEAVTRALLPAG